MENAPDSALFVDQSFFPFVHVKISARPWSDDDVERLIQDLGGLFRGGRRFVMLLDARQIKNPVNAKQRGKIADWIRDPEANRLAGETLRADAILVKSAIVRGAITAVQWIITPPSPTKLFASARDAQPWLIARSQEEGIPMESRAVAQLKLLASDR